MKSDKSRSKIPEWVLKYKQKGTEIQVRKDNYYLCKISSKWNPKKKRADKITLGYLGKITREGLIPPKHKRVEEKYENISVKECGISQFLMNISEDIIAFLKKEYPSEWKEIYLFSMFRLIEKTPLKRFGFYYSNSYISEIIKDAKVSQKYIGNFLRDLGSQRKKINSYMDNFISSSKSAVIDLTNVFTYSKGVISAMLGKNKDNIFIPQINLILLYSLDKLQPIYFRLVPGSIRDVSTIINTIDDSQLKNAIFIGDKGFDADNNIPILKKNKIKYVLAIKRNSAKINYQKIKDRKRDSKSGFIYQKRHIWAYQKKIKNNERIIIFLDPYLKSEEESDLMIRIKKIEKQAKELKEKNEKLPKKTKEMLKNYKQKLFKEDHKNGTLAVRTNQNGSPEDIFHIIKSRVNIEQSFDTLKNTLEADKTNMRDDKQMEGWMFINFIALQLYYKIYAILLKKKLLNNYSPTDIITHLKRINTLKIGNKWRLAEIPKKTRETMNKIEMNKDILLKKDQVTV